MKLKVTEIDLEQGLKHRALYREGKRKRKHWNAGTKEEKEKEKRRQILVCKVKTSFSSPQE